MCGHFFLFDVHFVLARFFVAVISIYKQRENVVCSLDIYKHFVNDRAQK